MALSTEAVDILALFFTSAAYGVYLPTFGLCLRALIWTKSGRLKPWADVSKFMLAICLLLPVFPTINIGLDVLRAIESASPTGPTYKFRDLTSPYESLKFFSVDFQTLLGDFVLTYRVWMVYGRSWAVAFLPILLWFGVLVTMAMNLAVLRQTHHGILTTALGLRPIITSFWAISISLNITATILICLRIYRVDNSLSQIVSHVIERGRKTEKASLLRRSIRILIESGALYTCLASATCISYSLGHPSVYIFSGLEMQSVGIAFNLIIIRVALGWNVETTRPVTTASPPMPLEFTPQTATALARHHISGLKVKETTDTQQDYAYGEPK